MNAKASRQLGQLYQAGEIIYRPGDAGEALYVIQEGEVEVLLQTWRGEEQLALLGAGQIFGVVSLFTADRQRFTTVRAVCDSHILSVDERTFIHQLHYDPSLAFRVLRHMAQRIYDLDHQRIEPPCDPDSPSPALTAAERKLPNVFDYSVGYHILVVEDDTDLQGLVSTWLSRMSVEKEMPLRPPKFSLTGVVSLNEAIYRLDKEKFDLILLDLNLPDSQGMETFRQVIGRAFDTPVVIFTGEDDEQQAMEAVHQGAQDYLVKNAVTRRQFVRSIRYALERHRFVTGRGTPPTATSRAKEAKGSGKSRSNFLKKLLFFKG
ncbi:MAG: cyclic nucleotide-binding domain-containing protein [Magnetococcales bacterium]|nr:cyclic nucleotide-binding domain-containing protein [Magnetococcales bacterium]